MVPEPKVEAPPNTDTGAFPAVDSVVAGNLPIELDDAPPRVDVVPKLAPKVKEGAFDPDPKDGAEDAPGVNVLLAKENPEDEVGFEGAFVSSPFGASIEGSLVSSGGDEDSIVSTGELDKVIVLTKKKK